MSKYSFLLFLVAIGGAVVNAGIFPRHDPPSLVFPITIDNSSLKENFTLDAVEEAVDDYLDLSNAFHSPTSSDALREKRTLAVFRTLANRTRSGIRSLRNLFSGGGSKESGTGSTGRRFREFFSNLLNRILVFLTNLFDRIRGFFVGNDGESSGGIGFVKKLRDGAKTLFGRFGGGKGGGGLLSNLLKPRTTLEPYTIDYSDDINSSDKKTAVDEVNTVVEDSEKSISFSTSSSTTTTTKYEEGSKGGDDGYVSVGGYDISPIGGYESSVEGIKDSVGSSSDWSGEFVPFPMDEDPHFHINGMRSSSGGVFASNPLVSSWNQEKTFK